MTPNITSARQAIQAELSHARQGAAFYSARVEALETALNQLESVDTDELVIEQDERKKTKKAGAKKATGKRGRPARAAAEADSRGRKATNSGPQRGRRAQKASAKGQEAALPTTGTDFWLDLVTEEPKSAVDIANTAAAHLGLADDDRTRIQKLKQRVAPALATLVATEKIQHTGSGRQRRYFKGSAKQAAQ